MSLSLGPSDIFSEGSRPRQTARLLMSSNELVNLQKVSSITRLTCRLAEAARILLLILSTHHKSTTTSCSKGPQGLHFPLGVPGLFTRQYFQKFLVRDSDNFVKPFMQVAIQTTRYYAHLCYFTFSTINEKVGYR